MKRIANNQLEKFRLIFSRCTNRDVAPLTDASDLERTRNSAAPCAVFEFLLRSFYSQSVRLFAVKSLASVSNLYNKLFESGSTEGYIVWYDRPDSGSP